MAALILDKTRDAGDVATTVVLCATHRLARSLRLDHDAAAAARGLARWQPLPAFTVRQWLDDFAERALLAGSFDANRFPAIVLTPAQEQAVWEGVIAAEAGDAEALFFDGAGLAATAAAANALMVGWELRIEEQGAAEDTRRFLGWRDEFRRRCAAAGWWEATSAAARQIEMLAAGAGDVPRRVVFAGFDRYTRQEESLVRALRRRGCDVAELELGGRGDGVAAAVAFPDRRAECHAAASWAAAQLAAHPAARVGIVVPDLAGLRTQLADMLDEALHPRAVLAGCADMPRRYNFSLGTALAREPLVDVALCLLRFAMSGRVEQSQIGALLRAPYWSADETEADDRARLDARMREALAPVVDVDRLLRFLRRQAARGSIAAPRLVADLDALRQAVAVQPARQLPSQWGAILRTAVMAAGWPGERALTSHEFQARAALEEVMESLAQFDAVLGRIPGSDAVARLARLCRERVFQPETEGTPALQIMGPLEAAGMRFDALWVMGMNDDAWPAAPAPNPLLPAEVQRRAGTPGASAEGEAAFAHAIHARLLRSAPSVTFSWARGEGDRVRRPSPLIAGLQVAEPPVPRPTLAETLRATVPLEAIDDRRAPPLAPGEAVRGGTQLLKAQAACPAWAYYRYRLGARELGTPAEGLDAPTRGKLLHAVLEAFWRGRSSTQVQAMAPHELAAAVAMGIDGALAALDEALDEPLSPRVAALERERLAALVGGWIGIEAARPAPFVVAACEQTHEVDIEGLRLRLTVDRIDRLEDGRLVVIDYKTGAKLDCASWAKPRILEPQLPAYAAWVAGGEVDAVAFARVRAGAEGFVGIAADGGLLPDVPGIDDRNGRRRFGEAEFPDWSGLIAHWRRAIGAVAAEVRDGEAGVAVADESALAYCEVKPLLRLAERRSQQESGT